MIVHFIWSILFSFVIFLTFKKNYLSATFLLASTTLLVEFLSFLYLWDVFFLLIVFLTFLNLNSKLNKNIILISTTIAFFLLLKTFVSGELYSINEIFRLLQLIIFCVCLNIHYKKYSIEEVFYHVVCFCVILNFAVHFLQIFNYDFAFSLKPTQYPTIGGFFNDSSELGPFFILSAFIFYFYFVNQGKYYLLAIPLFIAIFGVVISFNRTSFILLPILLFFLVKNSNFTFKIFSILAIFLLLPIGLNFSDKNFDLLNTVLSNPKLLFSGTLELRVMNWIKIYNHFIENCNIYFGCNPGLFDVNRENFKTGYGVFSVDNAFLRILVTYGVLFFPLFLIILIFLMIKVKFLIFWVILIVFGMMIELYRSLPVFIIVICCFTIIFSHDKKGMSK